MIKPIIFTLSLLILGQSCATKQKTELQRKSSKLVYSLITKDSVGVESHFSEKLKKSINGEMFIKAVASLERERGDMQAIEFIKNNENSDFYSIQMKDRKIPLKFQFSPSGRLDSIWINDVSLNKER